MIAEAEFLREVDPERDFVVLPEDLGARMLRYPGRKVVFNKNIFAGFLSLRNEETESDPYRSSEIEAAFTVSTHNQRHLQFAYPHLPVHLVNVEIDPAIFKFCDLAAKEPLIACSPKAMEFATTLQFMIRARTAAGLNNGSQFEWCILEGYSEEDVAEILGRSVAFVSLSVAEGVGRMTLEAMSSGCVIFAPETGPLPQVAAHRMSEYGNLLPAAHAIEALMAAFPHDLEYWRPEVQENRQRALAFSFAQQEQDVLRAWRQILSTKRESLSGV